MHRNSPFIRNKGFKGMLNSKNKILIIVLCILTFIGCSKKEIQSNFIRSSYEKKAEEQFNIARSLVEKADFDKAILEYQKVIVNYPQSSFIPLAQFSIGRCYRDLKDIKNSKKAFQTFLEDFPRHELSLQARVFLADLFEQEKNYNSAIKFYRQALINYKEDKWLPKDKIQFKLALCYEELSDYNQAIREFFKLIRKYPSSKFVALSKFNIGYCYAQLNEIDDAKKSLNWVIEQHPNTEESNLAKKLLKEINEANMVKNN